mmetsp:Transcript_15520/g.39627  ORF Transcript_15520/g.39627 Transcript_15520/m.39627 type:complete len:636 (-) Transcript_15520:1151-3058(-)
MSVFRQFLKKGSKESPTRRDSRGSPIRGKKLSPEELHITKSINLLFKHSAKALVVLYGQKPIAPIVQCFASLALHTHLHHNQTNLLIENHKKVFQEKTEQSAFFRNNCAVSTFLVAILRSLGKQYEDVFVDCFSREATSAANAFQDFLATYEENSTESPNIRNHPVGCQLILLAWLRAMSQILQNFGVPSSVRSLMLTISRTIDTYWPGRTRDFILNTIVLRWLGPKLMQASPSKNFLPYTLGGLNRGPTLFEVLDSYSCVEFLVDKCRTPACTHRLFFMRYCTGISILPSESPHLATSVKYLVAQFMLPNSPMCMLEDHPGLCEEILLLWNDGNGVCSDVPLVMKKQLLKEWVCTTCADELTNVIGGASVAKALDTLLALDADIKRLAAEESLALPGKAGVRDMGGLSGSGGAMRTGRWGDACKGSSIKSSSSKSRSSSNSKNNSGGSSTSLVVDIMRAASAAAGVETTGGSGLLPGVHRDAMRLMSALLSKSGFGGLFSVESISLNAAMLQHSHVLDGFLETFVAAAPGDDESLASKIDKAKILTLLERCMQEVLKVFPDHRAGVSTSSAGRGGLTISLSSVEEMEPLDLSGDTGTSPPPSADTAGLGCILVYCIQAAQQAICDMSLDPFSQL